MLVVRPRSVNSTEFDTRPWWKSESCARNSLIPVTRVASTLVYQFYVNHICSSHVLQVSVGVSMTSL